MSYMSDDRIEAAKERIVNEAIVYAFRPAGSGPADDLRDAIEDLAELVEAITLASVALTLTNEGK